jgi:hypothetical protein
MKFDRHDRVKHVRTGRSYMVLACPAHGVRLESTGEPGYLYQEFWTADGAHIRARSASIWARSASEMEDGRFVLEFRSAHGAHGRFPE